MNFSSKATEILDSPCIDRHERRDSSKAGYVQRQTSRDAMLEIGFVLSGVHLSERSKSTLPKVGHGMLSTPWVVPR